MPHPRPGALRATALVRWARARLLTALFLRLASLRSAADLRLGASARRLRGQPAPGAPAG